MPTITVSRDELFRLLGKRYTQEQLKRRPSFHMGLSKAGEEFFDLCFRFGIELDDVTCEREIKEKLTGRPCPEASDEILYKIDVPANRYDLLCLEGLVMALRVFEDVEPPLEFTTLRPKETIRMVVDKSVQPVRPFVVCAVLRGCEFTEARLASFLDLQDKLHFNICRGRSLVSIGTHDLAKLSPPFRYEARAPADIRAVWLNYDRELTAPALFADILANHAHLRPYLPLLERHTTWPVITDSRGTVLSLPPILNGNASKMTAATRDVFIEVTATDMTKANIVLNTVVCMFARYCTRPNTVEAVEITSSGVPLSTPDLSPRVVHAGTVYVRDTASLPKSTTPADLCSLLSRMGLKATSSVGGEEIEVRVPPTRSDVIHACDVMEDAAIAYGFNRVVETTPQVATVGHQQPLNVFTDLLREQIALAGYTEVLNFTLCSRAENFEKLRRSEDSARAVHIANPATQEFQVARTSLLVGLLKTVQHNKTAPLPLRLFEAGDVVLLDDKSEVGASNRRRLAAAYVAPARTFEAVHGLADRIMQLAGVPHGIYALRASDCGTYFPGRGADVVVSGRTIGSLGIAHPEVLQAFDLQTPVALMEFDLAELYQLREDVRNGKLKK